MPSPESISHIRRDLLSRPVRSYADKLTAELKDILRQHHLKTPDDLKRLAQEKKIPESVVKRYKDLISCLSEVVRSGKLPESDEAAILDATLEQAEELFGNSFLGPDQIEQAFTLQDGSKLIELDPATRLEALRLLQDKLNEPDIKEFLKTTPPETLQKDFILILRVPTFSDDTPLTMRELNNRLQSDLTFRNQGKLLYNTDWYKDEPFFTQDSFPGGMHWQLVSKEVLPETLNKIHSEQSEILKTKATDLYLDPSKIRRRTPLEVIYDTIANFRTTGTRLLERTYDWTDVKFSSGALVSAGRCDPDGADVGHWHTDARDGVLGAALSR